jgi:hypothetical protein
MAQVSEQGGTDDTYEAVTSKFLFKTNYSIQLRTDNFNRQQVQKHVVYITY